MDLTEYRASDSEQQRTADLMRLMPMEGMQALDVGARDGHFSLLMAERFARVVALDLTMPEVSHPKVQCIRGDAAEMQFSDESFDFVLCAEVLEHLPMPILKQVCEEIERVAGNRILIGVPFKQDIRVGRTTCCGCGMTNPPWGHVNFFDEQRLVELFPGCEIEEMSFVGVNATRTNRLSTALMDFAGNPYGTYGQEEPCTNCGHRLLPPKPRNSAQRIATRLALWSRAATELFAAPHGNWIHLLLRKR